MNITLSCRPPKASGLRKRHRPVPVTESPIIRSAEDGAERLSSGSKKSGTAESFFAFVSFIERDRGFFISAGSQQQKSRRKINELQQ
jgi:hypothetical protein